MEVVLSCCVLRAMRCSLTMVPAHSTSSTVWWCTVCLSSPLQCSNTWNEGESCCSLRLYHIYCTYIHIYCTYIHIRILYSTAGVYMSQYICLPRNVRMVYCLLMYTQPVYWQEKYRSYCTIEEWSSQCCSALC